jgi:alpha-tubulin suppressor-like RCC1 family protein
MIPTRISLGCLLSFLLIGPLGGCGDDNNPSPDARPAADGHVDSAPGDAAAVDAGADAPAIDAPTVDARNVDAEAVDAQPDGAPLQIAPALGTVRVGHSIAFTASGGMAPYTFSVSSGGGTITTAGVYTAGSTVGRAVVRVTDSANMTADAQVLAVLNSFANGRRHTCAIRGDGTLKCWGFNASGQLGQGDVANRGDTSATVPASIPPIDLGTGRFPVAVTAGALHTCALLDDFSLKCWGDNSFGQLGLGDSGATTNRGDGPGEMGNALPVVNLGAGRTARQLAGGNFFTCALLDDGTTKCWGANGSGQLGLGDVALRSSPSALAPIDLGTGRTANLITAGNGFVCARLDNASVKCWGNNSMGQLGLGDVNNRGDNAGEMGDALGTVALGTGRTATQLGAGSLHACAVLDDGSLKCWGGNTTGQLGYGDTNSRGDMAGEMGDALGTVPLGTGRHALEVTASRYVEGSGTAGSTCVLLDNATVKCWGDNSSGQLGQGDVMVRGAMAGQLGDALPAIQLGTGHSVTEARSGTTHVCVRLEQGGLKCWGNGGEGRLGLGDTANRGDNAGEMGDALPMIDLGM